MKCPNYETDWKSDPGTAYNRVSRICSFQGLNILAIEIIFFLQKLNKCTWGRIMGIELFPQTCSFIYNSIFFYDMTLEAEKSNFTVS